MAITGILFDLYGTLVDIETDESMEEIYRVIAHLLTYYGVYRHRWEVRERYYEIMKEQREGRHEEYPEIDVEAIWDALLSQEGVQSPSDCKGLAKLLAQIYRAVSRKRLELYPGVKTVLDELRRGYRIALVSDAQPCYALPEIKAVGLENYFDPVVISANYGFRKPDKRLIEKALDAMGLLPADVLAVGNDMYRDVYGASRLGIKTIFFDSNQGAKSHEDTAPDYIAHRFEDVLTGVRALSSQSPV